MSHIKVEVLGTGCQKCRQLESNAKEAIASLNIDAEITHITDPMQIAERGVMKTPALVVNGKVVSQGKVWRSEEIQPHLNS
jgi:small redox-active disulfide protein 2